MQSDQDAGGGEPEEGVTTLFLFVLYISLAKEKDKEQGVREKACDLIKENSSKHRTQV